MVPHLVLLLLVVVRHFALLFFVIFCCLVLLLLVMICYFALLLHVMIHGLVLLLLVVVHFLRLALLLLDTVHYLHLAQLLFVVVCHSSPYTIALSLHTIFKYSFHPFLCCCCFLWFAAPHFTLLILACWIDVFPPSCHVQVLELGVWGVILGK
jgi:hypothetical protein